MKQPTDRILPIFSDDSAAKVGKDSGLARGFAEYTPIIYNKNEAQL